MAFFIIKINNEQGRIVLKSDPSLAKTKVSLKRLMTAWEDKDQRFLVECRAIEAMTSSDESYEKLMHYNFPGDMELLIRENKSIFSLPADLPPHRAIDHQIHLHEGTKSIKVRPY